MAKSNFDNEIKAAISEAKKPGSDANKTKKPSKTKANVCPECGHVMPGKEY